MSRLIYKKTILPGNRIRVLIVDDSVVIRRLVAQALSEDPALEVVGAVSNGALALARIAQTNPDVVTLDVEMPEMDGIEMLRRLRPENVRPRVVMFSTLTERGAAATLDALALGADDYVTKTANGGSLDRSMISLREELIPKVKQFFVLAQPASMNPPWPVRVASPCIAGEKIAIRLGVSRAAGRELVEAAELFAGPLMATADALEPGDVDWGKAQIVIGALRNTPAPVVLDVQNQVLPGARRRTHAQLRTDVQRALIRVDPIDAEQRATRAVDERRVCRPKILPDAMAASGRCCPRRSPRRSTPH